MGTGVSLTVKVGVMVKLGVAVTKGVCVGVPVAVGGGGVAVWLTVNVALGLADGL